MPRIPMTLAESGSNSEQVSLISFKETHLKLHFSTETSGLNNEGGLYFEWSICIGELTVEGYTHNTPQILRWQVELKFYKKLL